MKTKRLKKTIEWTIVGCALMGIFSCATPISKDLRAAVTKDLTFPEVFQHPDAYAGSIVIWGGKIIQTLNTQSGTELIILESPLDYSDEPKAEELSRGRFIAKTSTFLDPAIYRRGRKITVAGKILGKETQSLGKIEYTYPVVEAKEIHLWRKTSKWYQPYPPSYYFWDPYWDGPYYDGYGSFWRNRPYRFPIPGDRDEEHHEDRDRDRR